MADVEDFVDFLRDREAEKRLTRSDRAGLERDQFAAFDPVRLPVVERAANLVLDLALQSGG